MRIAAAALAVLGVLATTMAGAASFDCSKASSRIDNAICASPQLSKLDGDLAAAYEAVLARSVEPMAVKAAQKAWLKETRNACQDEACMVTVYQQRIVELNAQGLTVLPSGGSGKEIGVPAQGLIAGTTRITEPLVLKDVTVNVELQAGAWLFSISNSSSSLIIQSVVTRCRVGANPEKDAVLLFEGTKFPEGDFRNAIHPTEILLMEVGRREAEGVAQWVDSDLPICKVESILPVAADKVADAREFFGRRSSALREAPTNPDAGLRLIQTQADAASEQSALAAVNAKAEADAKLAAALEEKKVAVEAAAEAVKAQKLAEQAAAEELRRSNQMWLLMTVAVAVTLVILGAVVWFLRRRSGKQRRATGAAEGSLQNIVNSDQALPRTFVEQNDIGSEASVQDVEPPPAASSQPTTQADVVSVPASTSPTGRAAVAKSPNKRTVAKVVLAGLGLICAGTYSYLNAQATTTNEQVATTNGQVANTTMDSADEMHSALVGKWAAQQSSAPECSAKDTYLLRRADGSLTVVSPANMVSMRGQWAVERAYGKGVAVIRTKKDGGDTWYMAYKLEGNKIRTNSEHLETIPSTYDDALKAALKPFTMAGEILDKNPAFYKCSEDVEVSVVAAKSASAQSSRGLAEQFIAKAVNENVLFRRNSLARGVLATTFEYAYLNDDNRCGQQWTNQLRSALNEISLLDRKAAAPGWNDAYIAEIAGRIEGQIRASGCMWRNS